MIIFNDLDIVSFKSIYHIDLRFTEMQNSFYTMEGKNNIVDFAESNGAGKSTIWDALSFVLYGTTMGIYTKNSEYQNKNSKIPLKLTLNFDITTGKDKGNYIVYRTLDNVSLYKNEENISEQTKTQTEKKLLSILNLTKDEFFNFTYLTQTQTNSNFLSKTASEKLAVLKDFIFGEELINIKNNIDSLLKEYKNTKNDIVKNIANKQGKLSGLKDITILSEKDIKNLENFNLQEKRQQLHDLQKQQQQHQQNLREVSLLKNNYKNLEDKMKQIKQKMESVKSNICPTCKQHLPIDSDVEQKLRNEAKQIKQQAIIIKEKLKKYNEISSANIENINSKISQLNKQIAEYEYNSKQLSKQQNIEQDITELSKEIEELENKELEYTDYIKQITALQKYFNTTFIQYVQQAFLYEIENYLNLYCYEVFNEFFSLKFGNNGLELFVGDHPYSYFSGGERQRIDFLFVFAIKIALSTFTDKCTNLLIFDESLSGSDSKAFDNSIELIDRLSTSNNLITILISHRNKSNISTNKLIISRFKDITKFEIINN